MTTQHQHQRERGFAVASRWRGASRHTRQCRAGWRGGTPTFCIRGVELGGRGCDHERDQSHGRARPDREEHERDTASATPTPMATGRSRSGAGPPVPPPGPPPGRGGDADCLRAVVVRLAAAAVAAGAGGGAARVPCGSGSPRARDRWAARWCRRTRRHRRGRSRLESSAPTRVSGSPSSERSVSSSQSSAELRQRGCRRERRPRLELLVGLGRLLVEEHPRHLTGRGLRPMRERSRVVGAALGEPQRRVGRADQADSFGLVVGAVETRSRPQPWKASWARDTARIRRAVRAPFLPRVIPRAVRALCAAAPCRSPRRARG